MDFKIHKILLIVIMMFVFVMNVMADDIILKNNKGVIWTISHETEGYAFGAVTLNGQYMETPLKKGIIRFIDTKDSLNYWFYASKCKQINETKAILKGKDNIKGVNVTYKVTVETPLNVKAVKIIYDFKVDKDIDHVRAVLQYNSDFLHTWKCHMYPFVENSKWIDKDTLNWMGIPSLFMYRTDKSMGMLWGIDPNFDYLNPETWTKNFGLFFTDQVIPAQYHVGGNTLYKNIDYHCPMQIVLTDNSNSDMLIIDLMKNWIQLNDYKIEPIYVRSNDEALDLFIKGRLKNPGVWNPGKGYGLHGNRGKDDFMYMGVQGMAAYFDYLLYELTGDSLWRERTFVQMDFIREGQNWDETSINYGAVHTSYVLSEKYAEGYGPSGAGWNSDDRWNIGYKPDICALCALYMLKTWKLVKDHEGLDRQDWYESAIKMIEFIMRQQNEDGGLAQKVQIEPLEMRWHAPWGNLVVTPIKFRSCTAGRALPAFRQFYKITGEKHYKEFMEELEQYHLDNVQNNYYFTGHHPDLPPYELTEASLWGVCEYWLDRYQDTGIQEYLKHAVANIYLAMTWWVPKQLSWVDNPTQGGAAEQQHYLSLTMYCYQNRKIECLKRLYKYTGNHFFNELYNMVVQTNFWTQKETENGCIGGIYERTSRPWSARIGASGKSNYNSLGSWYFNEQALDLFVQIFEMYRKGKDFYFGDKMTIKVYPDGVCYYSKDISKCKKIPFNVLPSSGSIRLKIAEWSESTKSWNISEGLNSEISLSVFIKDLKCNNWFTILLDGEEIGDYQSNNQGELNFTVTDTFSDFSVFVMRNKK